MPNQYVNHVIIDGETKVDLRGDTVDPAHLADGYIAHDRSGARIVGTMTCELQSKSATPTESTQVISPDSGYDGLSDVTINPIPSNYGRITWDGSVLTVS